MVDINEYSRQIIDLKQSTVNESDTDKIKIQAKLLELDLMMELLANSIYITSLLEKIVYGMGDIKVDTNSIMKDMYHIRFKEKKK